MERMESQSLAHSKGSLRLLCVLTQSPLLGPEPQHLCPEFPGPPSSLFPSSFGIFPQNWVLPRFGGRSFEQWDCPVESHVQNRDISLAINASQVSG